VPFLFYRKKEMTLAEYPQRNKAKIFKENEGGFGLQTQYKQVPLQQKASRKRRLL